MQAKAPPVPESAIPAPIPMPSYRSALRPFLPSAGSPSPKFNDSRSVLKSLASGGGGGGSERKPPKPRTAGSTPSAANGSPRTPIRCRRSISAAGTPTSSHTVHALPRSSALQTVNAVASPGKAHSAVPCPDAAAFFSEYLALLDAIEERSKLCPAADLADISNASAAARAGTAASALAQATGTQASEASEAEPLSVFALDQAMLLDEPELTLLVLIRMLSTVRQAPSSAPPDAADSNGEAPAKDGSNADTGGDAALARLTGMLQVAADGLHVASHCVLACEPVVLPAVPPAAARPLVDEWLSHARAAALRLSGRGSADADAVQRVTDALGKASICTDDCVTPDASPAPETCAGLKESTSAFVTPSASPLTPATASESCPRLRAGLAFLESQCFPKPDAAAAWYGPTYSWLRDSAEAVRKEGAAVFQNLLSACSEQGVPVLHEAVMASNVDAVELLLMLGASPLQRAPLADGTEVHWRHGITTPHSMPAPVLCSNTAVQQHLRTLVSRPAAWQPVLKAASGSTTVTSSSGTSGSPSGSAGTDTLKGASIDTGAGSGGPAKATDGAQQQSGAAVHAVVPVGTGSGHTATHTLADAIRVQPHTWPAWLHAPASKTTAPACGPAPHAGLLGSRSPSTQPPDDAEAVAAFDEVGSCCSTTLCDCRTSSLRGQRVHQCSYWLQGDDADPASSDEFRYTCLRSALSRHGCGCVVRPSSIHSSLKFRF